MMVNPYRYAADEIIRKLDRNNSHSRAELEMNVQHLLSLLGLPCNPQGQSNGDLALLLVAGILKEHGGVLRAMTDADHQLHD